MKVARTLALMLLLAAGGCFRTNYVNLAPTIVPPAAATPRVMRADPSGWQHFFVYGWVPDERVIYADQICGSADNVREIHTEQTFAQGLIAMFAGYYMNIYWPYTGKVICTDEYVRR